MKITVDFVNGTFVTTASSGKTVEDDTKFLNLSFKYPGDFVRHFKINACGEEKIDAEVVYTAAAAKRVFELLDFNCVDS